MNTIEQEENQVPDFWVECNACKHRLKNWVGSTPCCGSIAWLVKDGEPTTEVLLFTSVQCRKIQQTIIDFGEQIL